MKKLNKFNNFLSAPNFIRRAYNEIETINNKEYFLRENSFTKKLVDEILPLATFLKHFERPGLSIKCQYSSGNQNYDAKIKLTGYYIDKGYFEPFYFVEITSARNPKDYLVREALARYGGIVGYDVKRVGSRKKGGDQIIGDAIARDMDAHVKDAIEWIEFALEKKYNKKEVYPNPCILLIQVEPMRPLNLSEWVMIVAAARNAIKPEKFRAVYIVNWETNSVFKI